MSWKDACFEVLELWTESCFVNISFKKWLDIVGKRSQTQLPYLVYIHNGDVLFQSLKSDFLTKRLIALRS
jgi:hypothetical protein